MYPMQTVLSSDYLMIGRGLAPCGHFNQEIKQNSSWEYIYHSWAEGYLSAINSRNQERFGIAINLSPISFEGPAQLSFLKKYCAFNPNKEFIYGVIALFEEIKRQQ
jgi:hypothetical protein